MKISLRRRNRCSSRQNSRTTPSKLLVVAWLLVLSFSTTSIEASVSIAETGQTFDSRPERHIGQRLWKGYEYMGRLQYLAENPTLCPPSSSTSHGDKALFVSSSMSSSTSDGNLQDARKYRIVQPSDGLPVALLARRGGCSLAEKAFVAATMIEPPNTVQYLIVEDYGRRRRPSRGLLMTDRDEEVFNEGLTGGRRLVDRWFDEKELEDDNDESIFDGIMLLDLERSGDGSSSNVTFGMITDHPLTEYDDEESDNVSDMNAEKMDDFAFDNDVINLAVLHVSYTVGYELLDVISKEPHQTRHAGGTKIFLNGKEPGFHSRTVVQWMLSIIMMCTCCCCCLLMFVQTSIEPEQPRAPQRPVRRRLTIEQVRSNFPSFHFDPAIHHQQTKPQDPSEEGNDSESPSQKMYCQLLDECTICLDEFSPGDRCRQLPCGHIFHSMCIARWLIERSAVCPLCKLDLYEEEEEESSSDDENEVVTASTPSSAVLSWLGDIMSQSHNSVETAALVQPDGIIGRQSSEQRAEVPSGSAENANIITTETPQPHTFGESRSWWPFSLEIGDGAGDSANNAEFHGDHHDHDDNTPVRSTRRLRRSGVWALNWFGQRRRIWNQQQPAVESSDGGFVTELTEPLISDGGDSSSLVSPSAEGNYRQVGEITFTAGSTSATGQGTSTNAAFTTGQQSSAPPTAVEI